MILTESRDFPLHEKVYFLEVTGDGSYVADNYIAKHELPDFTRRPFTNICFAQVLQVYNKTKDRKKESLSLEGFNSILKHVKRIKALWEFIVEFGDQMEGKNISVICHYCIFVFSLNVFLTIDLSIFSEGQSQPKFVLVKTPSKHLQGNIFCFRRRLQHVFKTS